METEVRALNRKIHAIVGAMIFLISFIAYYITVAPTTSFWDCGEFIACSHILGVMHPPGAPLYLLIGRVLTEIPLFGDIGLRVNMFSVFISAATVLLTYLVIAQLIRRWRGEARTMEDRLILFFSSAFGALAFAFTDSQWFNSVEAEVYGFSMFFTVIVVWLMLFWEERSEQTGNLTIIILIFYIFGLAIGVHLLNVLTFPVILLIAYFHHNVTVRRLLLLVTVQGVVPMALYMIFFQFNPEQMTYAGILEHQAKAGAFLKYFGAIWIGLTLLYMYRKDKYVFKVWWIIPVLMVISYSAYLVIYLRAQLDPPINENDPSTLQGMSDYLARKQYGTEDMLLTFLYRKANFWSYQIQMMYTRYFGWQFIGKGTTLDAKDRIIEIISFRGLYGIPFFIGLWGMIHHFFRDWKRALAVLILFLITGYAIIIYLNQPDPQPRERDYSYVGSFFAFALWIGIGMAGIFEWISDAFKKKVLLKQIAYGVAAVVLLIAVPVNLFAVNFHSHNRTGNYVAYDYSLNMLESCEQNAIIFTNGDNDTFPLWFLQEVYGIRKDIRVVNLSLLNTPWYIKQLQAFEPKVPLNLSEQAIESLQPIPWKKQNRFLLVPPDVVASLKETLDPEQAALVKDRITFTLKPTISGGGNSGLRVQDLMVLRILQEAAWKKPVYFAVTVSTDNMIGLQKYFRMDGLAFKILPYEAIENDTKILRTNIVDKFQYRNLNNPKVHFNRNILKLLQNYRSAFIQLSGQYLQSGDREKALQVLDEMQIRMPESVIPYSDQMAALSVADLYRRLGQDPELDNRVNHILPGRSMSREDRLRLAQYYYQLFDDNLRAEEILSELIAKNPNDLEVYSEMFRLYRETKQYNKATLLLETWLSDINPNDKDAKLQLEEMRQLAAEQEASAIK
ncbi:DUF2723 domain-containing protein [candidate division KSB1 bacterium]|nr:DUF2723 domain-containing protein [candidate division KSB1 bacterium]